MIRYLQCGDPRARIHGSGPRTRVQDWGGGSRLEIQDTGARIQDEGHGHGWAFIVTVFAPRPK